jgi:hypothetical protein
LPPFAAAPPDARAVVVRPVDAGASERAPSFDPSFFFERNSSSSTTISEIVRFCPSFSYSRFSILPMIENFVPFWTCGASFSARGPQTTQLCHVVFSWTLPSLSV